MPLSVRKITLNAPCSYKETNKKDKGKCHALPTARKHPFYSSAATKRRETKLKEKAFARGFPFEQNTPLPRQYCKCQSEKYSLQARHLPARP